MSQIWGLCYFFSIFFLYCSDLIISIDLSSNSLTVSSITSILLFSSRYFYMLLFLNFHLVLLYIFYSWLRLSFLTFAVRMLMTAFWNIYIIAALKSLSDNSNISIISTLVSIDCLSPCTLRFSWLFTCWVILDCILNTLSTMLWGPWSYFKFHGK